MTKVDDSPGKKLSNNKRKIVLDSEDELFLSNEYEKKKKSSDEDDSETLTTTKNEEKENKIGKSDANDVIELKSEAKNDSSKEPEKLKKPLKQVKLSFKPLESKSPNSNSKKAEDEIKEITPKPSDTVENNPNDDWNIQDYLNDQEWKTMLKDEFEKKYFSEINRIIKEGYKKGIVRPPKELVFNALNSTNINQIKVVIIGQDPYHDDGQAHGLAFSVPIGIPLPPSLRNIFKEISTDIPEFQKDEKLGGCLQKWTQEGVFLLNTFLTVEAHKAGSHSKIGWDIFTNKVIQLISEKNDGCAFMLWGNFAQKKEILIDKKKHKVLKCAHPSPFSVTRFYGSKCFSQANSYLESIDKKTINWSFK